MKKLKKSDMIPEPDPSFESQPPLDDGFQDIQALFDAENEHIDPYAV